APHPVVHGFAHHPVFSHRFHVVPETRGIADLNPPGGLFPGRGADVYVQLLEGDVLGTLHLLHAHGAQGTVGEPHPLSQQCGGGDAAQGANADEAVVVDVDRDDADLVHVRCQHDAPGAGSVPGRGGAAGAAAAGSDDEVAQRVHPDRLGVRSYQIPQPVADGLFPARRPGNGGQLPYQLQQLLGAGRRVVTHADSPRSFVMRCHTRSSSARNASTVRRALSKSARLMTAAGPWMYRHGTDSTAVGTPSRTRWTAPPSVPP